ncbi:MAG: DJ-1/PfpI family protein, partial [Treponemataceae bacterium]|nr:DJ-1/PfpI family protein [Treponemataceae bacterium]
MKEAVVFLADGFEEIEAVTVIDYLRRAGVSVRTVAVPSPDMGDEAVPCGSHGIPIRADCTLRQLLDGGAALPDAAYVPGRMPGASNVAACGGALDFLKRCFKAGKIVSALCAAPAVVLARTGILAGRRWTCYPGMEDGVGGYCGSPEAAAECLKGSSHVPGVPFVVDGTVVTGSGPGTAEPFAMQLVELLAGAETADTVR